MSIGHGFDSLAWFFFFFNRQLPSRARGKMLPLRAQGQVVYGQHLIFDIIASAWPQFRLRALFIRAEL